MAACLSSSATCAAPRPPLGVPLTCLPGPGRCLQLRAALEEAGGQLPGFMRVCDCVVQAEGASKARFSGMIMEKINGALRCALKGLCCAVLCCGRNAVLRRAKGVLWTDLPQLPVLYEGVGWGVFGARRHLG